MKRCFRYGSVLLICRALKCCSYLLLLVCNLVARGGEVPLVETQIEDFEFAVTNAAATAGVTDITDPANRPTYYTNGGGPDEGGQSEGLFSLGTDALFGASGQFIPGSFIGFRRHVSPDVVPGGVVTLLHAYGDPNVAGPKPADQPLSALEVLGDFYGNESYGEGLFGTHIWVTFIDAEGERFNYINYVETSLFLETYTLDVLIGSGLTRIDPASLSEVPDGDRLLTEIVSFEVVLQDDDDPPTSEGKWYVDNLRIREPAAVSLPGDGDMDGDIDVFDFVLFDGCLGAPGGVAGASCSVFDLDSDQDVDFSDFGLLQRLFTE